MCSTSFGEREREKKRKLISIKWICIDIGWVELFDEKKNELGLIADYEIKLPLHQLINLRLSLSFTHSFTPSPGVPSPSPWNIHCNLLSSDLSLSLCCVLSNWDNSCEKAKKVRTELRDDDGGKAGREEKEKSESLPFSQTLSQVINYNVKKCTFVG